MVTLLLTGYFPLDIHEPGHARMLNNNDMYPLFPSSSSLTLQYTASILNPPGKVRDLQQREG